MLFTGSPVQPAVDGHVGFLAGRYRDGAISDEWTDALRCAPGTFTAYLPRCGCGWRGDPVPTTTAGRFSAHRQWLHEHLATLAPVTTAGRRFEGG